jgi:hypothetical protein
MHKVRLHLILKKITIGEREVEEEVEVEGKGEVEKGKESEKLLHKKEHIARELKNLIVKNEFTLFSKFNVYFII